MTTFLSCSLFLNSNLMKIKGFLSKPSGARDLRARGQSPFISQDYEHAIIFLSYLTVRTSPFIGQNSMSRHHQSERMAPSASRH